MPQPRMNHPESRTVPSSTFGKLQTDSPATSWIGTIGAALLSAYIIQKLLLFFDFPALSLLESAWNCFVYLMPSRLVFALRPRPNSPLPTDSYDAAGEHAAKSEVLRNVFGLDKPGTVPESRTLDGVPAGLGNWDNSCYQNSVLQSLASVKSLNSMFDNVQALKGEDAMANTTLSALNSLLRDLNNKKSAARHLWTPPKLKSMSSWQQQDAQEYFSKIVDQLEKDVQAIMKSSKTITMGLELPPGSLDHAEVHSSQSEYSEYATSAPPLSEQASHTQSVQNPLEGLLAQRVGCTKCGYSEGLSLIPFNCMTLPLGREWQCHVKNCLDAFTALEYIEGVECAKCTLLQSKHQLRQLSETLATVEEDDQGRSIRQEEQQKMVDARLEAVTEAIADEDFTDATLTKKCRIPSALRVTTTKSRQAIVARSPKCLVMHINRSMFDENSGQQSKNYADVQFDSRLDLSRWCMGNKQKLDFTAQPTSVEEWEMDPSRSMIHDQEAFSQMPTNLYDLQAVITHYGRHENGHYICYRKVPRGRSSGYAGESTPLLEATEQWWRLSDENVSKVDEEEVLAQGGVFMLFYERVADHSSTPKAMQDMGTVLDPVAKIIPPQMSPEVDETLRRLPQHDSAEFLDNSAHEASIPAPPTLVDPALISLPTTEPKTSSIEDTATTIATPTISPTNDLPQSQQIQQPQSPTPPDIYKKPVVSPATMRTAGLTHRRSDDLTPLKPLRMVATL